MTFGSICTGIGGLDLGLERAGMTPKWMCEIDPFCRRVLKKHWPHVPCYEDVRLLRKQKPSGVDVFCGGFPCQPHSDAGEKRGSEDERNLWPDCIRLVRFLRPDWCVFENVGGILTTIAGQVCEELEAENYEVWPMVFRARDIGARHRRRRVWFIAHSNGQRLQGRIKGRGPGKTTWDETWRMPGRTPFAGNVANADFGELSRCRSIRRMGWQEQVQRYGTWEITSDPFVCGGDDGIPSGVDRTARLRALGNAVVPHCAELIGRAIMAADQQFYCRESSNEGIHANR